MNIDKLKDLMEMLEYIPEVVSNLNAEEVRNLNDGIMEIYDFVADMIAEEESNNEHK